MVRPPSPSQPFRSAEWKNIGKYFLRLLVVSYLLMKLIVYLTRVLADYFMYHVWRFF
ncbi:MAG TPA: hypothetical protein VEZ44_01570 [bacterium]|nr:hypothetical protein [bacterium]